MLSEHKVHNTRCEGFFQEVSWKNQIIQIAFTNKKYIKVEPFQKKEDAQYEESLKYWNYRIQL